jgi:hypothetical protein
MKTIKLSQRIKEHNGSKVPPGEDDMVYKFEQFFPHSGAIVRIPQDELRLEFDDEFKPVKYSGGEYEGMTRDEIWTFEYEQNNTRGYYPTSFKNDRGDT